jgi:hypothetical protein
MIAARMESTHPFQPGPLRPSTVLRSPRASVSVDSRNTDDSCIPVSSSIVPSFLPLKIWVQTATMIAILLPLIFAMLCNPPGNI